MQHSLGAAAFVVLAMLTGCGGPGEPVLGVDDLLLSLHVTPDSVRAGDQLVATFIMLNPTAGVVAVPNQDGCFGRARVVTWDGDSVVFRLESEPCSDAGGSVLLAAHDSIVKRWTLTAWTRANALGTDTFPPAPGRYTIRLEPPASLPPLDAEFTVWPSGYWMGWRRCGLVTATASDSIVVSAGTETVFGGTFPKPVRIYNFTPSDVALTGTWYRAKINGVYDGPGWSTIVATVEQHTAAGWQSYSTTISVFDEQVVLRPNECLQARNPLVGLPSGTWRMGVAVGVQGWAYSEPVVVP